MIFGFSNLRKEGIMRRKDVAQGLCLFFLFLLLPLFRAEAKEPELVGQETPVFSLPSSQDRLISYADEYYGKYHLIITFFPAAFTPT
jgi:hypothetical protein